jgi:hypothetical protein
MLKNKPSMAAHTCGPREEDVERSQSEAVPEQKTETLSEQQTKVKRAEHGSSSTVQAFQTPVLIYIVSFLHLF